mgnify:CR=1 FL=1
MWASFVQSSVTQGASQKKNEQAVSGKSPWRERIGIEMKSAGPKEVKPLLAV